MSEQDRLEYLTKLLNLPDFRVVHERRDTPADPLLLTVAIVKARISDSHVMFRDDRTGLVVHEYRVPIDHAGGELWVRMPARLSREQTAEACDHLRCLVYDLSAEAALDDYERIAREELVQACRMIRKQSTDVPDLERARAVLESYAFFVSAVESYLGAAP